MISRTWFAGVAMLSSLGMFVPSRVLAQHGPGRYGPDSALAYDTNSEETFKGIVTEVKMGRSALYWLSQIHTLGLGHKGEQEKQLVMKTDTDTSKSISVRPRSSRRGKWTSERVTLWR